MTRLRPYARALADPFAEDRARDTRFAECMEAARQSEIRTRTWIAEREAEHRNMITGGMS